MNQIAELLPAANVVLDLDVADKKRLFEQIGALFAASARSSAATSPTASSSARSSAPPDSDRASRSRTGGCKGLKEAQGAFVRLAHPIAFDAPDGKPVSQVFVLLVPEHATDPHLQLLSELAQMFSERSVPRPPRRATDAGEILALIGAWQPE